MTTYQWLLGFHVLSALLFLGGAVTVGVIHGAAIRAERPSQVAHLLRLSRPGVIAVSVGALGSLAVGLWLVAHLPHRSLGDTWIALSLALWILSLVLGGIGGRSARHTRYLAQRLASDGDAPSPDLRRMLADPASLVVNYASLVAGLVILALMVWKP